MKLMNSKNRIEFKEMLKKLDRQVNKDTMKRCEDFCVNDFIPQTDRKFKNMLKKYKLPSLKKGNQQQQKDRYTIKYSICKKMFCNPKCLDINVKKTYSRRNMNKLRKKGALSGCIKSHNYNI